jgi:hypothetical protein
MKEEIVAAQALGLGAGGPGGLVTVEPACSVTGEGLDQVILTPTWPEPRRLQCFVQGLESLHQLITKRRKREKRNRNKTK